MAPHGNDKHSCEGDHNHDETPEMGLQYSLYSKIDMDNLECLNEVSEGSGKTVFKPWEERLNLDKVRWLNNFCILCFVFIFNTFFVVC